MFYLFVVALLSSTDIDILGRLMPSELFTLVSLPFLISKRRPGGMVFYASQFYIFVFLWFVGALASDIYRESQPQDFLRGWAKIFFFCINFTAISLAIGRNLRLAIFFIYFLLITSILHLRLAPQMSDVGAEVFGDGWRYGYGQLLTGTVLLLSSSLISIPILLPVGLALPYVSAALNLLMNARNLFGESALAAIAVTLTANLRRPMAPAELVGIGFALVIISISFPLLYGYAAGSGLLGPAAQEKYEAQSSGNLNILVAGRTESLASTQAIIDSPIIGHGSWARDQKYVDIMLEKLEEAGLTFQGDPSLYESAIPTHSHLLGAWVEAGILGAAFWFWAMWVTIRGLYEALHTPSRMTGFIVFIGTMLLWDIFFSPFGLDRRVITAAWLYLMMLVVERSTSVSQIESWECFS